MNYVTEVTDFFLAQCVGTAILDPMDYTIVAEWEKQQIPLVIVLSVIKEGCSNCKEKLVKIESIGYFQETVKEDFRKWLQTQRD